MMPSPPLLLLLSLLLPLSTLFVTAAPQSKPSQQPGQVSHTSVCLCQERSPNDYTINLWIVNKTTDELGQLSQGLRDNFGVYCQGYFVLWGQPVPLGVIRETGQMVQAASAPPRLGEHVYTGFMDLRVTGYAVAIDLEGKKYDGCLKEAVRVAEKQDVSCDCGAGAVKKGP